MTDEAAYSELTDAADARPGGQGESEACLCVHWSWRWLTVTLKPSRLPELQRLYLSQFIFFGPKVATAIR